MLIVILLHLSGMFVWHYRVVSNTGDPVIRDDSIDAAVYYDTTSHFEGRSPFSFTKQEIIAAKGGPYHLGYHYVMASLATLTSYRMLAVRILKTLIYFVGLAGLMRVWRKDYGESLPMYGFIFLSVMFLVPFYQNFRNYRDGLILGLFMVLMAQLDTLLRPNWQRLVPRSKVKYMMGWALVLLQLWIISALRFYLAAVIGAAIVMHLITAGHMGAKLRIFLLVFAAIVTGLVLSGSIGTTLFRFTEKYEVRSVTGVFGLYGMFRALVTPIPWQYFIRSLIVSHCFYLLLLPPAIVAFFAHLRRNLTWHFYTVIFLIYVLGGMLPSSQQRRRLILVPIFVMWVLADLAYRRGIHIYQRRQQLPVEQDQSMEVGWEQGHLIED